MKKATIVSCLIFISLSGGCMSYFLYDANTENDPVSFDESLASFTGHSGEEKICKTSIPVALRHIGCFMDKLCYVKCPGNFRRCKQTLPKAAKMNGCITITDCKVACFQNKGKSKKCNTRALKALHIKECKLDDKCALECCETHPKCPKSLPKAFKKFSCSYTKKCEILCKNDFAFQDEDESPDYNDMAVTLNSFPDIAEEFPSTYDEQRYFTF